MVQMLLIFLKMSFDIEDYEAVCLSQNRKFKKLRRLLKQERHINIVPRIGLSVFQLFSVGEVLQKRRSVLSLARHQ